MYNDILTIGKVTIHGYGLAIGVGVVLAVLLGEYRAKKKGLNGDTVFSMALLALIFGFVGAKLLFGLTDLKNTLADPLLLLTGSGFVVYGGIIGGLLAMFVYSRIKKITLLQYVDLLAPSVALAQGFGRIGCFLAGCCYGRETDSACGITFHNSLFAPNDVKLIPTQLISSGGDFLICAVLLLFSRKERRLGKITGLYVILYSIGRFLVEFLRDDPRGSVGILSTSQFIAIFMAVFGFALFFAPKKLFEKN